MTQLPKKKKKFQWKLQTTVLCYLIVIKLLTTITTTQKKTSASLIMHVFYPPKFALQDM